MYTKKDVRICVKIDDMVSGSFKSNVGVRQGDPTSAIQIVY
mgnify:CR=1 FL=1